MAKTKSGDPGGDGGGKPVDPRVARGRQDMIGSRLRMMYDEVVEEAVPDDFLSFLEQADGRKPDADDTGASRPGADAVPPSGADKPRN